MQLFLPNFLLICVTSPKDGLLLVKHLCKGYLENKDKDETTSKEQIDFIFSYHRSK